MARIEMIKIYPDPEELRRLFDYNPSTGLLTRKVKVSSRANVGDVVGWLTREGYLLVCMNYTDYFVHRLIWAWIHGSYPNGQMDHINGIRTDNRLVNLRDVTSSENARNRCIASNNKSGVQGVHWSKERKRWRVQIQVNGKHKFISRHKELEDAVIARKQAETKYGYHENHGRVAH